MPFQGTSRSILAGPPLPSATSVSAALSMRSGVGREVVSPTSTGRSLQADTAGGLTEFPDLLEPVVGFRSWRLENGLLLSPQTAEWWPPGTQLEARCLREAHLEVAPAKGCDCGIYAFYDAWTPATWYATRPGDWVPGAVLAWGRIEASHDGMRAQYARLLCLGLPPWAAGGRKRAIYDEATRIGIQVAPLRNLARLAAGVGDAVPRSLRGHP